MAESETIINPVEEVERLVETGQAVALEMFVNALPPSDVAHTINHLSETVRTQLFEMLRPEVAADLLEHFADEHAAEIIEELATDKAADILDELDSDDQADILTELDDEDAEAILDEMEPDEAADARVLIQYPEGTVGSIMHREFIAFPPKRMIEEVVTNLRANQEEYGEYDVSAVYVVESTGELRGVVRLRDILLAPGSKPVSSIRIDEPAKLEADFTVQEAEDYFDRHSYASAAVVDKSNRLIGVVRREAVEEAFGEKAQKALASFGGIIGGEELRTMSMRSRVLRRLAFLVPNVFLLLISASVIAMFETTVEQVTALAAMLPVLGGLGGCAGNQSVAVSIRELSLGLVKPSDITWIVMKEAMLGFLMGLVLGVLLFAVTWAWRGNPYLGLVVGSVLPVSIFVATTMGGLVPLVLTRWKLDPAMASGPILSTSVDFVSFFMVLVLARMMIGYLA